MRANLSDTRVVPIYGILSYKARHLEDGPDKALDQPRIVHHCATADQAKRIAEMIKREVNLRCDDHFHVYRAAQVELPMANIEPTPDEPFASFN